MNKVEEGPDVLLIYIVVGGRVGGAGNEKLNKTEENG